MNADTYVDVLEQATHRSFAFRTGDRSEVITWQREFRPKLEQLLGLDNIAKHGPPPLTARRMATEELPDHIREEWTLETEPGNHIPFFYLRPLNLIGKAPLVLTPHGHNKRAKADYVGLYESEEDRKVAEEVDRDMALQAVREGYLVIAPDMRGFASLRRQQEIDADANNSCRHLQMHALLFGRTLIGERVWDIERLIDWALTRNEVDEDAIVVTGNSGGGTVTLFSAAVDERIKMAIPGSYFCTFKDSIAAMYHCECNYIPGMMRYGEMYDVAGLIAPRPFMAVHGIEDRIYPIEPTRYAFGRLQTIYEAFDAMDACALSEGDGGHRYYKRDVWPFVAKHLSRMKDKTDA